MSNTNSHIDRENGEVSREEMIEDLRNSGWSEEDLQAIPDLSAG